MRTISTGVEDKHFDVHHMDFNTGKATSSERGIFFKHTTHEFEQRSFVGAPSQMVAKLKQSMIDRMKVILRDFIKNVAEKCDIFLFGMEFDVHCNLHLENIISQKIIVMIFLK